MELKLDEAMDLARLHRRQKRYDEAKAVLEAIRVADPDNAEPLFELGKVARDMKLRDIAINMMLQSVEKDDSNPDVFVEVSRLNFKLKHYDPAVAAAERAIALRPDYQVALICKANACRKLGRYTEAAAVLRTLVRLNPKNPTYLFDLGAALMDHGQFEAAAVAYRKTLQLDPNQENALNNLAWIYTELGNKPRAISAFRKALKVRPHLVRAHLGLALINEYAPGDPHFEQMQRSLDEENFDDYERCHVLFALACAHDSAGEYEEAFAYARQANEIRGRETPNDRPYWNAWIEQIMRADSEMAPRLMARENEGPVPVFVIGLPRSGKTLTESLLANSPQILDGREKGFFRHSLVEVAAENGYPEFPEAVPHYDADQLTEIGRRYFAKFSEFMQDKKTHLVNTSPLSYQYAGMILRCLPNAKFVFCSRGALDHALYMYFKRFEAAHPYAQDLNDALYHITLVQRMMDYWINAYGEERILSIRYEDIVANPKDVLRSVTDHIGIKPIPGSAIKGVHGAEIGRWRHYAKHFVEAGCSTPELDEWMAHGDDQEPEERRHAAG